MEPEFWRRAWAEGRTGFHQEAVHPELLRHSDRFLCGGRHRVLVPLCGKSVDLAWIRDRGHAVVGVELVQKAVVGLFEREASTANIRPVGPFRQWSGAGLTVLEGDFFRLRPELVGTFDRVWDRAAMGSFPPDVRKRYVEVIRSVLAPNARILMETFLYDQARRPGPPHAVDAAELEAAWGDVERLGGHDVTAESKARGWEGEHVETATWWIRP